MFPGQRSRRLYHRQHHRREQRLAHAMNARRRRRNRCALRLRHEFWISPQGAPLPLLHWLDGEHTAEVRRPTPGFLSVRRVRLEEDAADRSHAYVVVYRLLIARVTDALYRLRRTDTITPQKHEADSCSVWPPSTPGHQSISGYGWSIASVWNIWRSGICADTPTTPRCCAASGSRRPAWRSRIAWIRDIQLYDGDSGRRFPAGVHEDFRTGESQRVADRDAGIQFLDSGVLTSSTGCRGRPSSIAGGKPVAIMGAGGNSTGRGRNIICGRSAAASGCPVPRRKSSC